jgi:hypothetical protein
MIGRNVHSVISIEQPAGILNQVFQKPAYLRPVASIDPLSGMPTLTLDASIQLKDYRFVNPFFRAWLLYKNF